MSEREPDHNKSTDEEVWLDLVARLEHMDAADPVQPEPDPPGAPDESADGSGGRDTGKTGASPEPAAPSPAEPSPAERTRAIFRNQPLAAAGPRDYTAEDDGDDNGGFVPPEPPPLGMGEPLVVLSWLGTLAGPLLLLVFAMFWRDAPLAVILGTIAVFAGSAGYLLFRLPQHRDEGDDGAAV
ncbi:hypothetical protein N2K95_06140 [Arthrobacter zhaoxinii]|uniref:DUF308 domain-containing protein n=1 Tax=Arthrobacter zhaoxinii TaxID=2964616 RepID=A0ABY5YSY8_9MICC|nr:hypothetical protein [Arthrobacter zhaoxinii]UWX98232.1 hypothetical protein N2K95_06140 [Arthrobacter zhaoxinii]